MAQSIRDLVRRIRGPVTNEDILFKKYSDKIKSGGQYFFTTDGYWSTRRITSSVIQVVTNTTTTNTKTAYAVFAPAAYEFFGYGVGSINPDTQVMAALDDTNLTTPFQTANEDFCIQSIRIGCRGKIATYASQQVPAGITDPNILSAIGQNVSGGVVAPIAQMVDPTAGFQPEIYNPAAALEDTLMQALAANGIVSLKWHDTVNMQYDVSQANRLASFAGQSLYRSSGLPLNDNSKQFPEGWRWMAEGVGAKFSVIFTLPRAVVVGFNTCVLNATTPVNETPLTLAIDLQAHLDGVGFSMDPISQPMI